MPLLILTAFLVIGAGALAVTMRDSRSKCEQRARFISDYPSREASVLAVIDKDQYREIRDARGRTGVVHAVRAVMRDYPGITLGEATEVINKLDM